MPHLATKPGIYTLTYDFLNSTNITSWPKAELPLNEPNTIHMNTRINKDTNEKKAVKRGKLQKESRLRNKARNQTHNYRVKVSNFKYDIWLFPKR